VCVNYWKEGVIHNVPEADLTAAGWFKCTETGYNTLLTVQQMKTACQAVCQGYDRLLIGGKRSGSTSLEIAAMASTRLTEQTNALPVSNPLFASTDTSSEPSTKLHNGVYWYLTQYAFGFSSVPEISLAVIDKATTNCTDRLSWSIESGGTGYRMGCVCDDAFVCSELKDLKGSDGANFFKTVWCTP